MEITYFTDSEFSIFRVIVEKVNGTYIYKGLQINSLFRYLDKEIYEGELLNSLSDFSNFLQTNIKLVEFGENQEENKEPEVFAWVDANIEENQMEFKLSSNFIVDEDEMPLLQEGSFLCAEMLEKILAVNNENILKTIEDRIMESSLYNVKSIEDAEEVLRLIVTDFDGEHMSVGANIKGDKPLNKNELSLPIADMTQKVMSLLDKYFNHNNFNLLIEDTALIKVGFNNDGKSVITYNPVLLNTIDEIELNFIKSIIEDTYKAL